MMGGRQPLVVCLRLKKYMKRIKKNLVFMFHVWVTLMNVQILKTQVFFPQRAGYRGSSVEPKTS